MRTVDRTKSNQEAWKNVTPGTVAVLKFDKRGDLAHEIISGGKMVNLTPEERRINQEMCAEEELDFFTNGVLVPVRLIEGEDVDEIVGNPNHMTDEDMISMLKSHYKTFDSELANITNIFTLRRLHEIALSEDVDVSHRKVQSIEERLNATTDDGPVVVEREVISGPKTSKT